MVKRLEVFIQSNRKQLIGAKVAKYALETRGEAKKKGIGVTIMEVEKIPMYMQYTGMTYRREDETRTHDPSDLQFFTLSRFMPPELMEYEGRALVIDPDIFALHDIEPLLTLDLGHAAIAACPKKDAWDTSVMLLDCAKLRHWKLQNILEGLKNGSTNYETWMQLRNECPTPLARVWNSLDELTPETKMLHTTNRLTQPWKTGLPIDFTSGTVPKFLHFLPRFWIQHPTHYLRHPNEHIERLFFSLLNDALNSGTITTEEVTHAVMAKNIRPDIFLKLETL